ncbi:MAG: Mini-ribonuclease 3 [Defluviitaleaceae bacterium]|nr:Mini-ribonuclease 3 [Defluviitaleaceae bacterium]
METRISTLHLNPSELAYLGDAVFELLVREKLLREGIPFRKINRAARNFVSARAQSEMYHKIFPTLTQEEQSIMKRGRNLHTLSRAKNAGVSEYRHATGLEALFGYLQNNNATARLHEIFRLCVNEKREESQQ